MTVLSFEALWKDRGALQGLGNLGREAAKTSDRFGGLKKDLQQLGGYAKKFAHGVDRDFGSVDKRLGAFVGNVGRLGKGVGKFAAAGAVGLGVAGAAAGALGAKVVDSANKFDKSMRLVGVTTGQTGKGFQSLTKLALDMGAKTSFSAQGASDAMLALAKGGLTAAQIKGGALQETLTLATAGGLELGAAADYMVSGLTAFGLKAKDSARVAAALAGGANASTASVESMGLALSQVSAQAAVAGLSIEDTTAGIAALANNGIQGSDAGTSLKVMLQRLIPQTEKTTSAFKELGLITKDGNNQFFDAQGNMKSLTDVAGVLETALRGQTREQRQATLYTLFGSDATRAASILAKEGAKGLAEFTKATSDKTQADRLAKNATQGYAGALERFKGSVETAGIQFGTKFLPPLTNILNYLSNRALPAITRFGADMMPAFRTGGQALAAFWRIGKETLGAFVTALTGGRQGVKGFADFIQTNQGAIVGTFVRWGKGAIEFGKGLTTVISVGLRAFGGFADGVNAFTMRFIDHMGSVLDSAVKAFGWIPGIGPKLKAAQSNFQAFADNARSNMGKTGDAARGIADKLDNNLRPALDKAGRKLDDVARKEIVKAHTRDAVNKAAIAVRDLGTRADGSQIKIKKFSDITKLSADEQRAFRGRLADTQTALRRKLDAMRAAGAGSTQLRAEVGKSREALFREFRQMGLSIREARTLADRYSKVPKKLVTPVSTPGMGGAIESAKELKRRIDGIKNKSVRLDMQFRANATAAAVNFFKTVPGSQASGFVQQFRATGGPIRGHSPHTRADNIPVMATAGEFYHQVPTVKYYGQKVMRAINERRIPKEALQGFADGGLVSRWIRINTSRNGIPGSVNRFGPAGYAAASELGTAAVRALSKGAVAALSAATAAGIGGSGGPVAGGQFAKALAWARRQAGKPYRYPNVGPGSYDCSGFMGAIQNYLQGRNPHSRIWATGTFLGGPARRAGLTRNKRSAFMVGIIPTGEGGRSGLGHTAGTLNGVNVEASAGAGVRVGGRARGYNNGLFKYRYGLARGGLVGDLPFDRLDPRGRLYDPWLADALDKVKVFDRGGYLRPGLNLAYNGTGRREPVGMPATIELGPRSIAAIASALTVEIDGRQVARAVRYQTIRGTT